MTTALGESVTGPEKDGNGCDWETALTPYHLLAGLSPDPTEGNTACNSTITTGYRTATPEPNGCVDVGSVAASGSSTEWGCRRCSRSYL